MKKFAKGCLVVIVSLVIAGVVLLCVAAGGGVSRASLRELSTEDILRAGPVHLHVNGPFSWYLGSGSESDRADSPSGIYDSYEYNAETIRSISVDVGSSRVKVESSKTDTIKVVINDTQYADYRVELVDDRLEIRYDSEPRLGIGINMDNEPQAVVYIPEEYVADSMDLNVNSGELDVDTVLHAGTLNLDTSSGSIDCSKTVQADHTMNLSVNSGEMDLENMICQGELTAGCHSGELDARGEAYGNITAEVNTGSMEFDLSGGGALCEYQLRCNSGSMTVNGQDFDSINNYLILQGEQGAPTVILTCHSGELEFQLR